MYFPYLRGKQFEFLALREFAESNPGNTNIIPIIEPVKRQYGSINTAIATMISNGLQFAIILNPVDGDFKHSNNNEILPELSGLDTPNTNWVPAFFYKKNPKRLLKYANDHNLSRLMIILPNGVDVEDEKLMDFLANERIEYIVNGAENARSPRTRRKLRPLEKKLIPLEDCFKSRSRNSDYADPDDEFFSDCFASYEEEHFFGFADYTTLPKEYNDSGMLPFAVAIHLTYLREEEEIHIHHFVSDNTRGRENIQGKFQEAAAKIEPFYTKYDYPTTQAVAEFIGRAQSDDGYPGLGYIKKLSIENHLELINRLLQK